MTKVRDIVEALERKFPPSWQEDFDNTRLQVGDPEAECSGVMVCVDAAPEIVAEAVSRGCNMIVSHHPLIFRALKSITGPDRVDETIRRAIKADVAIYSCHTSVDNAPLEGVSWVIAKKLGLRDVEPLEVKGPDGIGSGVIGNLPRMMSPYQLAEHVKEAFGSPMVRCSDPKPIAEISRIGLCGGAGSFLIPAALAKGAQAFIASDCKHNEFIDYCKRIFLLDIGHYESEKCTKEIFYETIKEKFPNFALYYSESEKNPITYL